MIWKTVVRSGRAAIGGFAAALVALAFASPAGAATQVGQIPTSPPADTGGAGNVVQRAVAAGIPYEVPSDGTITSWSHRGGVDDGDAGAARLLVWRHVSGFDYRLVGRSDQEAITPEVVNEFPTQIPVRSGDMLGLRCATGEVGCVTDTGVTADVAHANTDALPDPGDVQTFFDDDEHVLANVAATLEPSSPGPGPSPDHPSNEFEIVGLKGKKLTLDIAGPGAVEVLDSRDAGELATVAAKGKKRLKPSRTTATAPGEVTVKLKLTKRAKGKLKRKRKLGVKAAITFTPTGGSANTKTAKLKLKKGKR